MSITTQNTVSTRTPRYANTCAQCVFLGQFEEYDLYFCPQTGLPTVIARYGSDGDYLSGLSLELRPLIEARKRASAIGLLTDAKIVLSFAEIVALQIWYQTDLHLTDEQKRIIQANYDYRINQLKSH